MNETYYFKTVLLLVANASKYMEAFIREAGLNMHAKYTTTFILNKINSIERDIRAMTSVENAAIIKKEMSDNWETLSVQNVLGMMVQMDDEKRRQVEEFTEKLLENGTNLEP